MRKSPSPSLLTTETSALSMGCGPGGPAQIHDESMNEQTNNTPEVQDRAHELAEKRKKTFFKVGKPKPEPGRQKTLCTRQTGEQKAVSLKIKRESYKISNRNVLISSKMVTTSRLVSDASPATPTMEKRMLLEPSDEKY